MRGTLLLEDASKWKRIPKPWGLTEVNMQYTLVKRLTRRPDSPSVCMALNSKPPFQTTGTIVYMYQLRYFVIPLIYKRSEDKLSV